MKTSENKSIIMAALLLIFGFLLTLLVATAFFYMGNKKSEDVYMELHTAPYISQELDKSTHASPWVAEANNSTKE